MERKEKIFIAFMVIVKVTILTIVMISIFSGCARPGSLSGGTKDTTPPGIDSLHSTANYKTNFQKSDISLTFDEWIKLNDAFNQVVISPPLAYKYKIKLQKRTVVFKFHEDEVLRENTTYTINFGDAIQDITEGNVASVRFVFSTGDFIDSLFVTGKIIDALTKKPVKDALIMLYDNLSDTVVRTERPFYFAKTDKDGNFKIQNVKNGIFKAVALEDKNRNYLFDQSSERIGFPDSLITVADSITKPLTIGIFTEEQPLQLVDVSQPAFGVIKMAFNKPPYEAKFTHDSLSYFYFETEKDSVWFWYDMPIAKEWNLYVAIDTTIDTVKIKKKFKTTFEKKVPIRWKSNKINAGIKKQPPIQPIEFSFNVPIEKIDTSKVLWSEDTSTQKVIPVFHPDSLSPRNYFCTYKWKEGKNYKLTILPDAIQSKWGTTNKDTLTQIVQILSIEKLGNISLTITDLKPDKQYIIELTDKSSKQILVTDIIAGNDHFHKEYNNMQAGNYAVKITVDDNKNGHWNSGSYDLHTHPEAIIEKALEPLRSNWDLKAEISIDDSK